ncbi:MAG TPA: hypothetical protein VFP56_09745 [Candidatus Limnocylindrales bacterium]|nr:hypothetical protein [Candidatus Limnocylindrales bacterium]
MNRRSSSAQRRLAVVTVAGLMALAPAPSAFATEQVTFSTTGAEQTWIVPSGVSAIHVVLIGGRGGDAVSGSGFGHAVSGDLAVTAGMTLYVEVGGNGANSIGLPGAAGGFNGGGAGGSGTGNAGAGGGGASDIRTVSDTAPDTLDSRLIVAGGGGGRGGGAGAGAGLGGSAGAAGGDGPSTFGSPGLGGGAGTSSAGGAGGAAGGTSDSAGTDGAEGSGGTGGNQTTGTVGNNGGGGGGGGGGFHGGGGGGAGAGGGGGGGGGSSYVGAATGAFISPDTAGVPSITISYEVGPDTPPDPTPGGDTGTVDAAISMADAALCLELSTTSIDFGDRQFGDEGVRGTPDLNVTNCGEMPTTLLARGTDASATDASWNLVKNNATCDDTLGIDNYHLALQEGVSGSTAVWQLGTSNTELLEVPAGIFAPFWPTIDAACPGSSGGGQEMEMQIVFVATEPAP